VLVVACGAGVTAGSFVVHPDVKRIVICDIEPLVPKVVTPMFGKENYHVVDGIARENPHMVNGKQVEVIYDDGRHFLRTTREKFDVITSDPIDPWVKGCASLYTAEYYRMGREHLNPGGVFCHWFPLQQSDLATAKSVMATFFQIFPNGVVWSNEHVGTDSETFGGDERIGYDTVLLGQVEPTVIDIDTLRRRLERPDHQAVNESLREVGFGEFGAAADGGLVPVVDLLATYAGQARSLKEWSRGAEINTDRNLRIQYLAGMSLNTDLGDSILTDILKHYRFPDQTFVGSPASVLALKQALNRAGRHDSAAR
jgi:spermidine synthase